jgi:hypothetical protein
MSGAISPHPVRLHGVDRNTLLWFYVCMHYWCVFEVKGAINRCGMGFGNVKLSYKSFSKTIICLKSN